MIHYPTYEERNVGIIRVNSIMYCKGEKRSDDVGSLMSVSTDRKMNTHAIMKTKLAQGIVVNTES